MSVLDNSTPLPSTTSAEVLASLDDYPDVTSWINDLLDTLGDDDQLDGDDHPMDLPELDKRVSQLSATLEVACEDTSTQLERTIDEISRTIPRLTYDLQFMREAALALQGALHTVESRSASSTAAEETTQALERLHFLDITKRNMEAALAVLREAEAWSTLESEVVSFLTEQDYARAATRLGEASKSLAVFQNTAEYESRKTLMVNLQNQLEASLSSALVVAISSRDVEACKRFFQIFCDIERESEFRGYWNGSKRKALTDLWEQSIVRDCDEGTSELASIGRLSSLLSEFHHEMLELLQLERASVMAIFPDPQPTLSTFITATLSSLQPSPAQRLSSLSNHYGNLALPQLIQAFKATEEFAVATDKIMEKIGFSGRFLSAVTSEERDAGAPMLKTHSRRRSSRMSISRRVVHRNFGTGSLADGSLDNSWDEALFEPFLDHQTEYTSLEKKLLSEQLRKVLSADSTTDPARLLRERSVDIFTMAEEALGRCMAFTHGFGAIGFIQSLDAVFKEFMASTRSDMLASRNVRLATSTASSRAMEPGGEDFVELDYSPEDYACFQIALHLLEATRGVLDRLVVFETKVRSNFMQTSASLKMTRADPTGLYFSGTTKGAITLLLGSSLNSSDLQTFLELVDPDTSHGYAQPLLTPASASFNLRQGTTHSSKPLLFGSRAVISDFARSCQSFLQDIILSPLLSQFTGYASANSWAAFDDLKDKRAGSSGAVSEVFIPTFSLSPTPTIQRVAEGLLNLPRLFEVYADDDALAFSIETLPFVQTREPRVDKDAEFTETSSLETGDTIDGRGHSRRLSTTLGLSIKAPPAQPTQTIALSPEFVASAWLSSLTMTLLSHLASAILPNIKILSDSGAAQLAVDLGYLIQIAKALNVEWEVIEQWKEFVELTETDAKKRLSQGNVDEAGVLGEVARLRGWNL